MSDLLGHWDFNGSTVSSLRYYTGNLRIIDALLDELQCLLGPKR